MEYASKLVERVTDFVLEVSLRQLSYIICYNGHVEELKQATKALQHDSERVEHQINDAKNNVKEIEADVKDWQETTIKKIKESKEFQDDEGHTKTGCSRGIIPFLWHRHRLGRKAKKMAMDVKSQNVQCKFDGVAYPPNPRSEDIALSTAGYVDFGSRKSTMENIMKQLEDSTVRMIGVFGPGGVGKTTLVNEIAKKARDNNWFNVVITVNITRDPNYQKIQEEIAGDLGLIFEGGGENRRAYRLRKRLMQDKENTLLILDDLWDKLDLNKLGIPFDDDDDLGHITVKNIKDFGNKTAGKDNPPGSRDGKKVTSDNKSTAPVDKVLGKDNLSGGPDGKKLTDSKSTASADDCKKLTDSKSTPSADDCVNDEKNFSYKMVDKEDSSGVYNGCKLLLTSKIRSVLSDKMKVKAIFPLTKLDDTEAETLFKKVADVPDENSKFSPEIVKYCGGLPMAIFAVARALKDKSELVWKGALEKLKKQELIEVHNSMEISVKMSYDHLESEELKSIFLLCAQRAHQPLTVDLVNYCFGLGILKGVHTLMDARERISKSIAKLKGSSLMLDGNSSDHFDMHDMVRDAALSIAQKDQNVFISRNDKLDDWPDKDELEKCTSISVYKSDILDELPEVINCPQLEVFHIDSDDPNLKIPEKFFEGMKKLRVLILTGIHLQTLPSSIGHLPNLRMLCLERCILDNLSGIEGLKKLRILSLTGSKIEKLPELGGFSKLQLLDISNCSIRSLIPPNSISRLTSLEELYIRESLIKMKVEGKTSQSQFSVLSELKHLHQLKIIDACIPSSEDLPTDVFFDKLNDYKIVIGDFKMFSIRDFEMPNKYEVSRSLALRLKAGTNIHSLKGVKLLFKTVVNLLLGELNGVKDVLDELNLDGFPDLKYLSIINNRDIEYIIHLAEMDAFPKLESLSLFNLEKIKKICCSRVTDTSFSKLKTIKVKMCTQLKNLFSFYIVKFLTSLETIDISECVSLETVIEEGEVSDKVKFPKLRSLTMQELPSFISFYTNNKMLSAPQFMDRHAGNTGHTEIAPAEDEQSVTTSVSLFDETVEIPSLESLKLSSISIHNIWSDQISSFCFQNLIKLIVEDCNLTYLCSLSVASGLKKLKGLFVSNCEMMESLFTAQGNSNELSKDCFFPKLEEIQLINMEMLNDIWPAEVGENNFPSLISVHIDRCKKLDKIFPSYTESWYQSLETLKVVDCKSVEVIFEIRSPLQKDAADTKLQYILLEGLKNLKQVWSRDPEGVVNFTNLRSIKVLFCDRLNNVLPASIAKALGKLENFSIQYCQRMEEIVVASVAGSETSTEPLVFPEVTSMKFRALPNIRCFYMGRQTIECPKLKRLMVGGCATLEAFTTERPVFSAEKVISNLEHLDIGPKEIKWLQRNIGKYRMHRLKQLCLRSVPSAEILYWFLHRIPNLEMLELRFSDPIIQHPDSIIQDPRSDIRELVPSADTAPHIQHPRSDILELVPSADTAPQQRLGSVLQLKELTLCSWHIEDIGFERDQVLQRSVERLVLLYCRELINLARSSVSFSHLIYLEVNGCDRLKNLMASSTAMSLVRLTTMKVIGCTKLKEIVTDAGNEEEKAMDNIVFWKLITMEFVALKELTSFCSYKNCEFSFPLLEKLVLRDCPKMKTFTESRRTRAPKLQHVLAFEGEQEDKWYWEGDLNATIKKVYADKVSLEYMSRLDLSSHPDLANVWRGNDPKRDSFGNLKTLVVENCGYLGHVIPPHLLPCFKNLEELRVRRCNAVQFIFIINDKRVTKAVGMFRLKRLSLIRLPKLERVWDEDPEGVIGLKALRELEVDECNSLKYVFPASLARDLGALRKLSVVNCQQLVEIFAKDETASEGAIKSFVFRSLTSLELRELPMLKYFYPGLHMLQFPVLKNVNIHPCKWVILNCQDAEGYLEEQLLIPVEKVDLPMRSLEKLSFGMGHATVTWHLKSQKLELEDLQRSLEQSHSVLYQFLQMVPNNVEKLVVKRAYYLEEMFSADKPNADYAGVLSHLKGLRLYSLSNLKSIGLEHSWLLPITENLQTLEVVWCSELRNLAPCTVSFSNLTNLVVSECDDLLYLFTSSTAKSLARLEGMEIRKCGSMQEIVSKESDESHESGNIIFEQLQALYLEGLPMLRCFYSGNYTLCFPSLEEVSLIDCLFMKSLCPRIKINQDSNKMLSGVGLIKYSRWEGDIDATIRKMNERKIAESAREVESLLLGSCPHFQEMWLGSVPVPDPCFSNLESLVVEGCEFLSGVLPSYLLRFLNKMQKLEVRNCNSVKTIFDVECITNDQKMIMGPALPFVHFSLETLVLEKLPNLESVWNEDPRGVLRVQLLQEVRVDTCKRLTSLFPTSVAKDLEKLETLEVKHCEGLVQIVAGIEAAPEGKNLEFTCPCLTSLTLLDLPKLKCFPLKIFTGQDPHIEDQICVEEVTPHLANLSLGEEEMKMIWHGQRQGNHLHKVKVLNLQGFNVESDELPYGFLEKVPNIEDLVVSNSSFKEIFCSERPNVDYTGLLSQLKKLKLDSLPELISIGLERSWVKESFLKNLETLEAESCFRLKNLVSSPVCFSSLMHLTVSSCYGMIYLFTSSTAKSLAQLKQMDISWCESIQEIVSEEGDESHHDEIIFGQLQKLELQYLQSLKFFYNGSVTLSFPSLEELSVIECSRMDTFSAGTINANKLPTVKFKSYGDATTLEVDLNSTIRKAFKAQIAEVKDLRLKKKESPYVQEIWHGSVPVPDACFSNLESLVVEGCEFLSEVLPSNLLPFLNQMQNLEVRKCSSVKTIFDVECLTKDNPLPFSLKTLVLEKLPNLESVWNENPDRVLSVQLLQEVRVDKCKRLTSLFPTSVVKDLEKLETLEVKHCEGLVEIVAGIEAAPEGTNLEFTFPCLTSLTLLDLPKLKCFYCSLHCVHLKLFTGQDPHTEDQICVKEVTPNLANLSLGEKEMKMIWHGQCPENHLHEVKVLDLQSFNVESDELPYGFLEKVPNIEDLVVSNSSFKEIFCSERPNVDYTGLLSQLKKLKLDSLPELISIGLEHSWVEESFLKILETLEATSCSRLRNLVSSPVCFSNLMHMSVSNCEGMIHLFTSLTAKSLAQLKHMDISSCKSIQEIVSKEGDESHHDEIIFGQLQKLELQSLPNLKCFYNGSVTLSFPSLEELSVIWCSRMDTFCAGTINANRLSAVKFKYFEATTLEVDLNFTIRKAFEAQLAEFVKEVEDLKLVHKPEVHEIWRGSFPVPSLAFISLKTLIVERCEFLSNAIPSHILGLLCNLEELAVRQCDSVKAIFEVKDAGPAFFSSLPLKKLTFEQLPNLEHVWESDPQEVIGLQNLQEMYVHGCDSLERLFPALVAERLVKLEKLEVQRCGRLAEIVAKDQVAAEDASKEFVLPCMTSIKLEVLPELKCFYPGPHKLECPKLKQVLLFHCDKLRTITCESQSYQEAQPEKSGGVPLYLQALFLAEKVIPYLEFALSKEEVMMIWHGQFHVNPLHKLQALQLQCFHDDSDAFPYGLLQKVPNIEKLAVSCSSFKEIFCSERPNKDCAEEILSHLKCLQLSSLSQLNSIGLEHSWMKPISENVEKLQIDQCRCLRNIVPCKVSFSSLVELNMSQCAGLLYLFTPSTSRTLHQLKNMSVKNCESLEEIVSEEVEESSKLDEEKIIFEKLKTLSLKSLPRLGRFYNGSVALSFPSLDQFSLIDCRMMESFCASAVSVNKWTEVKIKEDEHDFGHFRPLEVDLNYTVRKAFEMLF